MLPHCGKKSEEYSNKVTGQVHEVSQLVPQTPEPSPADQSATSCEPVYQRTLLALEVDGSKIPIEGKYPVHFLSFSILFKDRYLL